MEDAPPRLLVGLGNSPAKYETTRHNVGRRFIEYVSLKENLSFKKSRHAEEIRMSTFFGLSLKETLTAIKLKSYMNESGVPLKKYMNEHEILLASSLIIFDDFMIPFGSFRLRVKGSSGGHNGLKSIQESFLTQDIPRIRIGIGPVPAGWDPADYVLESFSKNEDKNLPKLFDTLIEGIKVLLRQGPQEAMSVLNRQHLEIKS